MSRGWSTVCEYTLGWFKHHLCPIKPCPGSAFNVEVEAKLLETYTFWTNMLILQNILHRLMWKKVVHIVVNFLSCTICLYVATRWLGLRRNSLTRTMLWNTLYKLRSVKLYFYVFSVIILLHANSCQNCWNECLTWDTVSLHIMFTIINVLLWKSVYNAFLNAGDKLQKAWLISV